MFDNVIVGVDQQQGGRDALALAVELADHHSTMTLARIIQDTWQGTSPPVGLAERNTMNSELETMARDAGLEAQVRCHGVPRRSDAACTSWRRPSRPTCWSWAHLTGARWTGWCSAMTLAMRSTARPARSQSPPPDTLWSDDRSGGSASAMTALPRASTRSASLACWPASAARRWPRSRRCCRSPPTRSGSVPFPSPTGCDHSSSRLISDCRGCPMSNPTRSTVTRPKRWPRSAHRWT